MKRGLTLTRFITRMGLIDNIDTTSAANHLAIRMAHLKVFK